MPAIVHIDYRYADNAKNLPRLRAVMAKIDSDYYRRLAEEAKANEEVSLQQRTDHDDLHPAP